MTTTNFRLGFPRKGEGVIGIALGGSSTKVVHVEQEGDRLVLRNYLLLDAPVYEGGVSTEVLTSHLTRIREELGTKTRSLVLVIGMGNTLIRTLELPLVAPAMLPAFLRQNSNHYFQENLKDFDFGISVLTQSSPAPAADAPTAQKRQRVLVSGTKSSVVGDLESSSKAAGLAPAAIVLSQAGLFNAAMLAVPEVMGNSVVALVDLGFHNSTISFSVNGELGLSRVVPIGGHKFTSSLAAALGVPYAVAEGIKTVMPDKVQAKLQDYLAPLGQELRAAIDFFESQEEKKVTQILVSGGTARSDLIVDGLQTQLGVPCQRLDLTQCLKLSLPPEKEDFWTKDMPALTTLLGAVGAALRPELLQLNLLAEKLAAERTRRRDPFKRAVVCAALLVLGVLAWAGQVRLEIWTTDSELAKFQAELGVRDPTVQLVRSMSERTMAIEAKIELLGTMATNRFHWVDPLNALQFVMVEDIQVVHVQMVETITIPSPPADAPAPDPTKPPPEPPRPHSTVSLIIRAKNTGPALATDRFIESISSDPYFSAHLVKDNPVVLRERLPPQVDPLNPARSFVLFTLECFFSERPL